MVAAYILIDISINYDAPDVLERIRAVSGVRQAHLVVGPNDAIAYVEAPTHEGLMTTLRAIRAVTGVDRTDMRAAAEL